MRRRPAAAVLHACLVFGVAAPMLLPSANAQPVTGPVSLVWPNGRSRSGGAMPRLRDMTSPAARRINAALEAADRRLRTAISDCAGEARDDGARGSNYERAVTVAMAGPMFLSIVISDSAFCGGLHPNFQDVAFTFDLVTGKPVNWVKLLPAPLIETTTTEGTMDGASMGLVRSKVLLKLDADSSEDCGMTEESAFQLWPDAARGGLNFAWADPPHANMNCGAPAVLDLATLRRYGASPVLIHALEQAQAFVKRGHS